MYSNDSKFVGISNIMKNRYLCKIQEWYEFKTLLIIIELKISKC